ncbi:MAG: 2OG-Fe(II) oxygenase [Acidobacteria bacterium]|nr:2OG-Fe(II) oxygenase [Acidobacteriota bacterium]
MTTFFRTAFRWQRGRQNSGYDKMLLLQSWWPLPFDLYLLRYPEGSEVPPHRDTVSFGRHYRLNVILWRAQSGGDFACAHPIVASRRLNLFRPDIHEHSVSRVLRGTRYVLSLGWIRQ